MFYKKNGNRRRRSPAPESALSPRFARLVRESWCLLVAAILVYIALILSTYAKSDRGFSFTGTTDTIANRGGVVGAYLSDLLLYLFGLSAWWWVAGGVMVLVAGFRRIAEPDRPREHPMGLAIAGFALVLLSSAAIESIRLWKLSAALPLAPGGAYGHSIGNALARAFGFNGATLLLLAAFAIGCSLLFGVSWLKVMERIGATFESLYQRLRERREREQDRRIGEIATAEREQLVEHLREEAFDREPVLVVPPITVVPKSERVVKEKQRPLFKELPDSALPPLSLLEDAPPSTEAVNSETLEFTSRLIERKLADFGVAVKVLAAYPGPVITRFEVEPAVGVKGAQIVNLMKDLARALSVVSIRVVETIPGKSCMALELPNPKRQIGKLVEILESTTDNDAPSPLTLAVGKDIAGKAVIVDLNRMPHLLVAGTTGSGKSVAVNAMILSLLYKADPKQVRMILIDPKMLELSVYEGIPHLLAPVVTDTRLAPNALTWCVAEMDRRYKLMNWIGARNLSGYNHRVTEQKFEDPFALDAGKAETLTPLAQVVVVIDELADLMMVVGKKVEELIARLAQKARAAGIHLILATQRPSVDVITGLIKANIPTRIAFQVASKVDSRTILDQSGAETLLGAGDMLYLPPGSGLPQRVHGAFVADHEVHKVVEHLKALAKPEYLGEVLQPASMEEAAAGPDGIPTGEKDPLYDQAVEIVLRTRRPSISLVQRHLRIGYNRAARLIEDMERAGMVSTMQSNGNREVLVPAKAE